MDYEGLGWGAIEVIRSRDKKIARLAHVPASRLRVLKGWKGFVEIVGPTKFVFYQNFGEKLVSKDRNDSVVKRSAYYNPREDGPLKNASWNLVDKDTGKPTANFKNSASELLWIPKHHSNTIYYGLGDVVPALGHILANIHIRDYFLQFFEYNAVPQYAIIIKGGKLTPEVKQTITKFFSEEVKGKAHKTLIIPVPATGGDVEVKFEKLSTDVKEGSFQATRKNNAQGIMTAHGVSPAIIGVNDAASLGSGKGLSQAEIYKDRVVTPSQKRWAGALNKLFRLGLGISLVRLEFDPLDIRDMQAESTLYGSYLDRGVLSINDVRKFAKLGDPIAGGERAFIKLGNNISFVDGLENADMETVNATNNEIDMLKLELKKRSLEKPATPNKPKGKK
jgi:capsid portal protein